MNANHFARRTLLALVVLAALTPLFVGCGKRDTSNVRAAIRGQWRTKNTRFVMKEQKRNEFKNGKLVEMVISPESIEQKPELDGALYYFGPDLLILVEPSGKTFEWPWKAASFNETTREMNIITGLQKPVTIPIRLTDDSLSARVVQDLDYLRSEQDWEYVDRSERPSR